MSLLFIIEPNVFIVVLSYTQKQISKIRVVKVDTLMNCADILTKGLPTYKFKHVMKVIRGWGKEKEEFVAWVAYMQDHYEQ